MTSSKQPAQTPEQRMYELELARKVLMQELERHKANIYERRREYERAKSFLLSAEAHINALEKQSAALDMEIQTLNAQARLKQPKE